MPSIGTALLPSISGLSWFGDEEVTREPSFFAESHAQPEPNLPAAFEETSATRASKLPKSYLILSASFPLGSPPAFGAIVLKYRL